MALEFTELRILSREAKGGTIGAESSILKVAGSEIQQRVAALAMEAVGYYALPDDLSLGDNEAVVGRITPGGSPGAISISAKSRSMAAQRDPAQHHRQAVLGL